MRRKILLLAPAALLLAAADPVPSDWSTADLSWLSPNAAADYGDSRAICAAAIDAVPPALDRPTAAEAAALEDCDSEALYFGIGMPADPAKARQCAFVEAATMAPGDRGAPFHGTSMLMVIYANGRGANRDLRVATHLACSLGDAPAEMDGRIKRLEGLRTSGWSGSDFDPCDDATSGYLGGQCAAHEQRFAAQERERAWQALTAGWPAQRKTELVALTLLHDAFVEAHGDGEVDMRGTLRVAMHIAATSGLRDEYLALIRDLDQGKVKPATFKDRIAADRRLNQVYRALLANDDEFLWSDVGPTKEGVRATERAWIAYRDAMLGFARRHYRNASQPGLFVRLTDARTGMLRMD